MKSGTGMRSPSAANEGVSVLTLVLIAVVFAVLGGLAGLVVNEIRDDSEPPAPPSGGAAISVPAPGR